MFCLCPCVSASLICHSSLPAPAHPSHTGFMPLPPPLVRLASRCPWSHLALPFLIPFSLLGPFLKCLILSQTQAFKIWLNSRSTTMTSRQCHSALLWALHHDPSCPLGTSSGQVLWLAQVEIGTKGQGWQQPCAPGPGPPAANPDSAAS